MEKFSKKIIADEDAYYMSCPEFVANFIADKLSMYKVGVELCSAVGISVICLAKKMDYVYGVDLKQDRIDMSRENAKLYGVDNVSFICGDVLDKNILSSIKADVVLMDPDWSVDKETPSIHGSDLAKTVPNAINLFNLVKETITDNIVIRVSKNVTKEDLTSLGNAIIYNIYYDDKLKFKYAHYEPSLNETKEINVEFNEFGYKEVIL